MYHKMKICNTCQEEKSLDDFPKDKRWRSSYKKDCKLCYNKKRRESYNPDLRRIDGLRQNYGISYEEYYNMYIHQKGCCAICNTPISLHAGNTKKHKAHVDHCHDTKKIRGLLCTKCNTLLGMANDNVNILESAKLYLERSQDD
jgi:hypothetical protein